MTYFLLVARTKSSDGTIIKGPACTSSDFSKAQQLLPSNIAAEVVADHLGALGILSFAVDEDATKRWGCVGKREDDGRVQFGQFPLRKNE